MQGMSGNCKFGPRLLLLLVVGLRGQKFYFLEAMVNYARGARGKTYAPPTLKEIQKPRCGRGPLPHPLLFCSSAVSGGRLFLGATMPQTAATATGPAEKPLLGKRLREGPCE